MQNLLSQSFSVPPPYTRKKSAADPTLFYLFIYFDRGDV
jgi:hypothetical protein